ncbi:MULTISPECIES: SusC/RagA family TonB-linked outer membrane protein [Sphingobacterium]|uniref:SusC/RagA family TonB-linked outer membrane protein n=1 Tax=Sphingobacterium TaxID=28453 RepID=UPI0013D9E042|nr:MULTISPECIES: SusC/RagA family TonB-linked outer membrane protein [unclassified Sphingobacterium]
MRNTLLFSLALGLAVTTVEAKASKVSNPSNLAAATAYSSNRLVQNTVTGTVSDANGPMPGVTVSVVEVPGSTRTDANGQFKISAALGSTLRFSSVGYLSQDIKVVGNTLNVELKEEDNALEEVVIVGYGTQKKAHLTGAVSSINVEEVMGSRPVSDVGRGMQGTIPGLSVVVPSGEVGSDPIMKIRGQVASIEGSNSPLILVDNVEIPSINLVNPNDIESVTVLKDAASSSIYGAKAAFGVILITTKKGSKTDTHNVTYSNNLSLQSPFKDIDIAGIDGLEYTLEAHENMKSSGPAGGFWRLNRESFEKIKEWQQKWGEIVGDQDPIVYGRDWYYEGGEKYGLRLYNPAGVMVKDNAFSHLHNLGLNGKSGNTNYNLGVGFLGQQGMMKPANHDDFTRYNATLSLSTKVTDYLTLRGGTMYSDGTKRYANSATGFGADPWLYLYRWSRLFPIGAQEHGNDVRDPYFDTKNAHTANKINRFTNLNLGTTVDVMEGWDLQMDYAYSTEANTNSSSMPTFTGAWHWYAPVAWNDAEGNRVRVDENGVPTTDGTGDVAYRFPVETYIGKDKSNIYRRSFNSKRHTFNAFSTYNKSLDGGHDLKFMLGTNMVSYSNKFESAQAFNLINDDNPQFTLANGKQEIKGGADWNTQVGFFGRANYSFKDRYLFEANLRYDGTSIFPKDLRWRWYPSVSAGWVMSNESFMDGVSNVLTFAKLRGSWGNIGDQSVPNGLYNPSLGEVVKSNWLDGLGLPYYQVGTPRAVAQGMTWQDIEHSNIGVDLRLFNKFGVVFEWFERKTKNMIVSGESLPNSFGAVAPKGNYGNLRTRGWELNFDYKHRFENGLGINLNANLADAVTVITKGTDWNRPWEERLLNTIYSTGRRYGDIYGYVTDRLYQKEDFVYDADGNHIKTTIIHEGTAKETHLMAGDNPIYQTFFEDGNGIMIMSPGDVKFVDVNGDGYITDGDKTNGNPGDKVVIGNSTPRYEYGFRLGADYKGFDLSVFLQGVGQRQIWGSGQLAIPGFHVKDGAMPQAIAGDFWKEDRTDAFYPRAWHLGGADEGYVMRPQTRYLLDMSYFKIKNITFGYAVPENILRNVKLKNARIYVSLENFFTFDNLRGLPIDPETISGNSMLRGNNEYNLGRTGTGNPSFKSASMGIQIGL